MDVVRAKAISFLRGISLILDPRGPYDSAQYERLVGLVGKYTSLTGNVVNYKPTTQEERNALFFMCLDIACTGMGVHPRQVSADWTFNAATMGVLGSPDTPFDSSFVERMIKNTAVKRSWGPLFQDEEPFLTARVRPAGVFYIPVTQNAGIAFTSGKTMDISIAPNVTMNLDGLFNGLGVRVVRMRVHVSCYDRFIGQQGMLVQGGTNVEVVADGNRFQMGSYITISPRSRIEVVNRTNANVMVRVECVKYTTLDRNGTNGELLNEAIANVYTYHSPLWNGIRRVLLEAVHLPVDHPPFTPLVSEEDAQAMLVLEALSFCFVALAPEFRWAGVVPVPGAITRAIVEGAYW